MRLSEKLAKSLRRLVFAVLVAWPAIAPAGAGGDGAQAERAAQSSPAFSLEPPVRLDGSSLALVFLRPRLERFQWDGLFYEPSSRAVLEAPYRLKPSGNPGNRPFLSASLP